MIVMIFVSRAGNINTYGTVRDVSSSALQGELVTGILKLGHLGALPLLDCWCVFGSMVRTALIRAIVGWSWKAAPVRCSPIVYSLTLMPVNSFYTALCIYGVDFKLILIACLLSVFGLLILTLLVSMYLHRKVQVGYNFSENRIEPATSRTTVKPVRWSWQVTFCPDIQTINNLLPVGFSGIDTVVFKNPWQHLINFYKD